MCLWDMYKYFAPFKISQQWLKLFKIRKEVGRNNRIRTNMSDDSNKYVSLMEGFLKNPNEVQYHEIHPYKSVLNIFG